MPVALQSWAVGLVGAVALVQGLRRVRERRRTPVEAAELPTLERAQELPRPGGEFDEAIERNRPDGLKGHSSRRKVGNRLERAAVGALVCHRDLDEAAAHEALAEGTWTDDPVAAAQFLGELPAWTPLRVRAREWMRRHPHSRRAERAAAEIARIAGIAEDGRADEHTASGASADPNTAGPSAVEGST
ncbi:hypothetical protein SAMN06269185_1867 [Natronoarchaeum philippinense]|uniref:Uncharacterized protein n=2 Tax=Natronoarchaeum philippinense TaxID=558529 RepID=A0A285NYG5_NATPI|nr:hypothetical protein SAMN06269185_1867 [Natronoarchaeum philippinense]